MNWKVTISRKVLAGALSLAGKVVSGNTTLPVLRNVMFSPIGGGMTISATDINTSIELMVAAQCSGECVPFTVPAKRLAEVVAALPEGDVVLTPVKAGIQVQRGSCTFVLPAIDAVEFPAMADVQPKTHFSVDGDEFHNAIRRAVRAVSDDGTRPIMTGVVLNNKPDGLQMAATDTHRLVVCKLPGVQVQGTAHQAIVPAVVLETFLGIPEEGAVEVAYDDNQVMLRTENVTLVSRLIDGTFPNYERIIPPATGSKVRFNREDAVGMLKRVRIVAKFVNGKVLLTFADGRMHSKAVTPDGEAEDSIEAEIEGNIKPMAFNEGYLIDALEVGNGEIATLTITSPLAPVRAEEQHNPHYLSVVMPMQQ